MTVVALSKPIQAHGETLTEITLRPPTVAEVIEFGLPHKLHFTGGEVPDIELIPKIGVKYIARIAAIPPSSVEQVSLQDLQSLLWTLVGFFGESDGTSQS